MLRSLLPPAVLLLAALALLHAPCARDDPRGGGGIARGEEPRGEAPPRLVGRYRRVTPEAGRYRTSAGIQGSGAAASGSAGAGGAGAAAVPARAQQGAGCVAGRVCFPDGTPAALVAVQVTSRSPTRPTPGGSPGPGRTWCTTTTDAEGSFRAEGLRPGLLRVEAPAAAHGRATVRAVSGMEDVQLVVRRHRTLVRVLDPEGRPLAGADVGVRYVVAAGRQPIDRCAVRPADGGRNLWLDPGAHVIVAAHLDGHTVAERDLVVPDAPWSWTVDLVLVPHGPETGSLRLHLADETGRPLAPPDVVLTSPLARSLLSRDGPTHHPDADGVVEDLPPGTYCAWVHPVDGPGDEAGRYGFVLRRQVTIRPGAQTRLDLRTTTGGRLLLQEWCEPLLARHDVEARVRFERPEVTAERTLWLDPDDEDESMLLEPGAWTMVVYGEGVREARRPVFVEAGTTRVETVELRVP